MVTFNPEAHRRVAYDAIAGVGNTADLPKPEIKRPQVASAPVAPVRPTGIPSPQERLANILNVDVASLGRTTPGGIVGPLGASAGRPVSQITQDWAQQKYIKDNTPWYLDAITTGPIGGFLNVIQKPLAFTTSALKETIDVFTGGEASWGDFKKQYNDNYTFGRLLHDYDILQDRDSGWQKFAAAALGFIGDVALDPLSYLGLVGKGVAFGSILARKGGAKAATRELVRKSVLTQLRTKGDDIMSAFGKGMRRGEWEALSDDLAQKVVNGGKTSLKDLGKDGWEWSGKVSGLPEQTIRFTNDEVLNFERLMDIGGNAGRFGATAVSGDDLRFAARMFADSGLDRNLRHGADEFVDELGRGLREQVDEFGLAETVDQTISEFYKRGGRSVVDMDAYKARMRSGAPVGQRGPLTGRRNVGWLSAEDAANMKLGFGIKVPGTGPIGRKLRIAPMIEKVIRKTGASGAQIPIGLRLMTSETPIIGKLVTGIPQGVRNGILRQAAQAAGVKKIPDALRRGGLWRLAGKKLPKGWELSGRMGDLKTAIKTSSDGVFIQQGKRVIHAMARGRNKARFTKVEMSRMAGSFMDEVNVARSGNADVTNELVYSAMGGNEASQISLEAMAPGLWQQGMDMMESMRVIANNAGARLGGHIGKADNYVPRQLTPEAHAALKEKLRETGKFSERLHGRRMGEPGGPELTRNYISKQQFDNEVAALAAKDGISTEAAEEIIRRGPPGGEGRTYEFFGTELLDPGSKMGIIDPTTGKEMIAGSVEDQIAEAIEAAGGNYQLFTNDIEMALKGYIDQVSHRVGEVYTESLLFNEGILVDRMAEYVRMPTAAAIETGAKLRAAQEAYVGAQGTLLRHLNAVDDDVLNAADEALYVRQREKLEEIVRQKEAEIKVLDKRQGRLIEENIVAQNAYDEGRKQFEELTTQMEVLDQQISGTPVGPKLVALERERLVLMNAAAELAVNAPTLRFAYETLTSSTVQLMHLERAVGRIFGTGDAFDAFYSDDLLRGLRTDDLNANLLAEEQAGNLPDSITGFDGPDGTRAYVYQTPEGKTIEIEQLFMDMDEVLQQSDANGVGVWLGVERDLDIMRSADNEVAKIGFALERIRTEVDEMQQVINQYAELAPDVLAPNGGAPLPTPDQVTAAQAEILRVSDELSKEFGPTTSLQQVAADSPELRTALATYYAGSSRPVSAFIDNGNDLEGIISQISDTLYGSIDGVKRNIVDITAAAEASGQKVRLRIVDAYGHERHMGVADYVQMEQIYKHTEQFQATMQSPADAVRLSIDEILDGTMHPSGQLGSNPGGRYEINGKEYYVKQYGDETADGWEMPPGTGRDRITSEVLANAVYRELGIAAPASYASRSLKDGSLWHIAPWIDDMTVLGGPSGSGLDPFTAVIVTDPATGIRSLADAGSVPAGAVSQTVANALTRGMAADMLLANWDVVGMGFDNIGVSASEGLVRIDQGSTFFYRAQGSAKADAINPITGKAWLPEAMTDIERAGGMLDPSVNEWYAPLIEAGAENVDEMMKNQVRELLDMRLKAGGMENFVRRMMPTPVDAQDDLTKFVEFFEVRLEAMANAYGQEFAAAGSDEMVKAALAARGFSEEVVEKAVKQGTEMRLFHLTAQDPPLILSTRFGASNEVGWGDKTFLNMSPGNMYYGSWGQDYGYNMLLDLPTGAKGIKIYNLASNADEVRAAEMVLEMSKMSDPDEIAKKSKEIGEEFVDEHSGVTPVGSILLDQVSRVAEADPDFLRQFLRIAETGHIPVLNDNQMRTIHIIKAADDLRHIPVPTDVNAWNLNEASRSVLAGKLAASSFEDRLKFVLWLNDPEAHGLDALSVVDNPSKLADGYSAFLADVDPAINTNWASGVAEEQYRIHKWGNDFDYVLHGKWRQGPGGGLAAQSTAADQFSGASLQAAVLDDEQALAGWYLNQFFHKYQNSLSADGYHATMWLNNEGAYLSTGSAITMPNFLATNPLALRSADVAMTHRNISRLAGAEHGVPLRPEDVRVADKDLLPPTDPLEIVGMTADDVPITAMDEWESKMKGLGDTKTPEEISDELFSAWPPLKEHPYWASIAQDYGAPAEVLAREPEVWGLTEGDFFTWLDEMVDAPKTDSVIFDPNLGASASPQMKGTKQALGGETKFIESLPFMEWWEADVLAGPGGLVDNGAPDPDILQTLVERRVQVMADMTTSKQLYDDSATALEEAVALRNATETARSEASLELSALDIEEWMANTAITQKTVQMNRAIDVLGRMGAPGSVPLENIPDELVDLRLAVGALVENDQAMLKFAMDEFDEGAKDWVELVSQLPEGTRDIHKIGQREDVLEYVFRSGMKPFGQLQGNATLVESMLATERFVARGGAAGFWKKYDKLHNLLRAYMIAKPGFHGRNFMSAVFMNHLSGINWSSYRRFMRAYWKYQEEQATAMGLTSRAKSMRQAMRGRLIDPDNVNPEHVQYIRTLAESGALGSGMGQVATEFVEQGGRGAIASNIHKFVPGKGPLSKKVAKRIGTVVDAINPANTRNLPLRLSKQFGMATETFVRGSLGFDTLLKGGNASDAFDDIMKFHFDYDDLSDFERNVVKRVVPFYTWTRKNLPLMMEQFVRRPEVFNRYMSLKKEIELQTDGPPGIIPKWMMRQGAIQLPFKYKGEDMFFTPDLPFKAPMELLDPALAMDPDLGIMQRVEIALGSIGTQITPLIKAPYEWKAKQNLWKGYNFDGRFEVVPRAYTIIPGLMPLLEKVGAAGKTAEGEWAMQDYTLHAMAQLLPTFTDLRRLFPDETRYQERAVSNWVSWLTGVGLRTNTKYEQEMEIIRRMYEGREEEQRKRSLRSATLR